MTSATPVDSAAANKSATKSVLQLRAVTLVTALSFWECLVLTVISRKCKLTSSKATLEVSMQKVFLVAVLAIGLLLMSPPMFAHHGTGISYDATKPMTIQLTVTEFRYSNPHPQLYGDAQGAGGKVEHWGFEIAPNIAQLIKSGWSKKRSLEALAPGTKVTVEYSPSRAGGTVGVLRTVKNAKGEQLLTVQ